MISIRDYPALLDTARYALFEQVGTRFADLDRSGRVGTAATSAIFQDSGSELGRGEVVFYIPGERAPMMVAQQIEFISPMMHPGQLRAHFGLFNIGRTSWQTAMVIVQDGKPCAFASNVMVMTNGSVAVPIPEDIRNTLTAHRIDFAGMGPAADASVIGAPLPALSHGTVARRPATARDDPQRLDPARYPFCYPTPVRFSDLDYNDHVNNVGMVELLEDARMRSGVTGGIPYLGGSHGLVVVAHNIEYMGQARYPGVVDVHLAVLDIGRSSYRIAALAMQEGSPCAFSVATLVMTDGKQVTAVPDSFRIALADKMFGKADR